MILDNYIKQDFVKSIFMESCLFISDIDSAEKLAKSIHIKKLNLIFETSYLKQAFLNKLKIYHPKIKIINCDSSKSRLMNDMQGYDDELIVFDKVNYCDNINIFNIMNKMKRILIYG